MHANAAHSSLRDAFASAQDFAFQEAFGLLAFGFWIFASQLPSASGFAQDDDCCTPGALDCTKACLEAVDGVKCFCSHTFSALAI